MKHALKIFGYFLYVILLVLLVSCTIQVDTPVCYTINYETVHGETLQSITVTKNTVLSEREIPFLSVQGYSFVCWYDGHTIVEPGVYKVTKDITLTAIWNIINYTVCFDANNGNSVEQVIVQEGKKVTRPGNPIKESTETETYTFDGWYTSDDGGETFSEPFDFNSPIIKDITLYAKWNTNPVYYTITYETELGIAPQSMMVLANTILSQIHLPQLNVEGNSFVGWFYENTKIDVGEYIITKDMTLTAKWNVMLYTVSFDSKGGTIISSQSIESGQLISRPTNPIKSAIETETYAFENWYTSENGGTNLSTEPFDFDKPITKDITLYAKWTVTPITYTITYSTEYGTSPNSITMPAKTILYGSQLPVLTKDYFTFKGWYDGNTKAEPGTYILTKDVTLVAKWEKIYYTVNFTTNGGSSIISQSVEGGGVASKPEDPIKPDSQTETYTFENWYTSTDEGITLSDVFDFNTLITDNVTLYAKWIVNPISAITISNDIRFGNIVSDKVTVPKGDIVTLTVIPNNNFTLNQLIVETSNGISVTTSRNETDNTKYSFTMPEYDVLVNAVFVYQFHSTPTFLEAGTDGTAGKNGTYVYFGDWPQTIKAENVTVNETQSMSMGGFTYYKGSDGYWYVKCIENAYEDRYYNTQETYSDGTIVAMFNENSTKYFKVEPIKWRVLNPFTTTEKKILLAEAVLMADVPYYGLWEGFGKVPSSSIRTLGSATIYANNYRYSNIRAYLNGTQNQFVAYGGTSNSCTIDWSNKGFLQSAFTLSSQTLIADTEVDNSLASTNPTSEPDYNENNEYTCNNTNDKIFLLSVNEVTNSDYGFPSHTNTSSKRVRVSTDYAKANYAYQSSIDEYGTEWWLRSPTNVSTNFGSFVEDGLDAETVMQSGRNSAFTIHDRSIGIVPALCLN